MKKILLILTCLAAWNVSQAQTDPRIYEIIQSVSEDRIEQDITTLAGLNDIKKYVKDLNNISLKKISAIFLERAEKKLVKKALESTSWNRKKAAKLLDISYKSLLNKIKEYKLN